MKNRKKHIVFDDFRRYRANEMTPDERNAFEKELQKDPFMAEALEGLEQLSPEEMSLQLLELSKQISSPKKKRKIRFVAAAASILILVSIGILWLQISKQDPVPELTQTEKMEHPAAVQEKQTEPELKDTEEELPIAEIEVEPDTEELQQEKTETDKITTAPKPKEAAPVVLPIEKKEPVVVAEALEEKEEELPIEALSGRVQGVTVQSKITPQMKGSVAKHVAPGAEIRIRGYATLQSNPTPPAVKVLKGKVISASDKLPLPGVSIVENGTSNGTVTDVEGNFVLPLTDSLSTVTANFIGMEAKVISPTDSLSSIIELEPDQLALDEVVVVGYGVQKKESLTGSVTKVSPELPTEKLAAEPVSGYKTYYEYLKSEAILPADYPNEKEVVRLRIKLNKKGEIESIENLNHADETLVEKAKQIVLNGPAWKPELLDDKQVDSTVKLRIVFRKEK
ncbi:carboxypeptidase-like regulatory domain-containing protein [Maribellus sp. YY47]|uniref:carboxypeptidase-like regulatory domain-containing protein n=1 Tax=Maribellus sp. YY47 TaxID=2929486 RepID=UPI002001404B|nr:carboxypeptidase-like regulatory domain-containing protein [Maribellus sp. YY47]MCK3684312.1 carboxypeptidase-like regulatory domain-containing protein [Maribellus sp. YY47]